MESQLRENLLLGLGNPLLDISVDANKDFLEKYGLKPNDAIIAEEKHLPMYQEMTKNYDVEYIAGGACQNTMRITQWLLGKSKVAAFMGCIGRDDFGEILEKKAKEAGVNTFYQYNDSLPTGTCAVVITDQGANRSLCANLSAANTFSKSHIQVPENRSVLECADYFYITSFFLTVSPETILEVAQHAAQHNKGFFMNLSAPFLAQFYQEPMMESMPYVDILFGNEQEAVTFSEMQKFGTKDIGEIALKICNLPKKNEQRQRVVIITQGGDPVIMAKGGKLTEFPVIKLKPEEIVDTNGAGDAFVGGFLAQYIQRRSLELCIKCGIYSAMEVIKQSGCAFPEKSSFQCDVC